MSWQVGYLGCRLGEASHPGPAAELSESYVATALVYGVWRAYAGAARLSNGGADARLHAFKLGKGAAFLRERGASLPEQCRLVYRRSFPTFREALVDEAAQLGARWRRREPVRGAHVPNVRLRPGQAAALRDLAQACRPRAVDGRWANIGALALATPASRLKDHLDDACWHCHQHGHYAKACPTPPQPQAPKKVARKKAAYQPTKGLRVRWDASQSRWQFHRKNNTRGQVVIVEGCKGWEVRRTQSGVVLSLWADVAAAREEARKVAEAAARGSRVYA